MSVISDCTDNVVNLAAQRFSDKQLAGAYSVKHMNWKPDLLSIKWQDEARSSVSPVWLIEKLGEAYGSTFVEFADIMLEGDDRISFSLQPGFLKVTVKTAWLRQQAELIS